MGIQDTKNRLPYRQINMFERQGAHIIDAANPLFLSGLRHAKARFAGEHEAAIAEFQAILHSLLQHFDAKRLKMAFDGRRWPHKEHEDQRRSLVHEKAIAWVEAALQAGAEPRLSDYQACVRNTPLLILLAKKLCEAEQVACVVAPYEADPQLVAEALATGCAIISYDTDMLALGAPTWIGGGLALRAGPRDRGGGRGGAGRGAARATGARAVLQRALARPRQHEGHSRLALEAQRVHPPLPRVQQARGGCDYSPSPLPFPRPHLPYHHHHRLLISRWPVQRHFIISLQEASLSKQAKKAKQELETGTPPSTYPVVLELEVPHHGPPTLAGED